MRVLAARLPSTIHGDFMKQLKASVWIMAIIGVLLVIASLLASFGKAEGVYSSPIFLAVVAVFTLILIFGILFFPFSFKKLGFFVNHIGLAVIVVSAVISWQFTKDTSFSIPINNGMFYGEVMQDDGSMLRFGFDISVADFEVEKYEADYRLFNNASNLTEENTVIDLVYQNRKGVYDLGVYGSVSASELKDENGYVDFYELENGYTLVKLNEVAKNYRAALQIWDEEIKTVELAVNKPYVYEGWKFYLMGYDEENMTYVNLYVKKDPANIPLAVGIWMVIIGTFAECMSILRKEEKQ